MEKTEIKLSFIAPVYNVELYINRFLTSYLSQTIINDTELILVDDSTPDNSVEIIKKLLYENPQHINKISILHHDINKGLAAARQTGLNAAKGEYIIFVDSDDFFDSNLAEELLKVAERTSADIICSDLYYEYQYGSKYVKCKYNNSSNKIISKILNNTIGCVGQYTRIVKKSIFEDAQISFTPDINMFEDRLLAVKLFTNTNKIAYLPKAFYHYVQYNNNSITKNPSKKAIEEMLFAEKEISNYLLSFNKNYKRNIYDFRCYIKFLLWLIRDDGCSQLAKQLYPEVKKYVLFSKSIPKLHTRFLLLFFLFGHEKLSKQLTRIIKKIKNNTVKQKNNNYILQNNIKYSVSIIIVNYNTRDLLRNCLKSLYDFTKDVTFEVFVSDNGSKDGSIEMLRKEFPQVKIVDNNANLGFGAANNRALSLATGKYIFYLNSDTVLVNNAVKIFYDYFEQNNLTGKLGAIGANLLDEKDTIIHSAGRFRSINLELKDALHDFVRSYKLIIPFLKHKKLGKEPAATRKLEGNVDYVTGADLFVKRDETAFFDEQYFLYYEETDMQKRMSLINKERKIIEGPLIRHLKGGSNTASNPLNFYQSVSKINTFLSCCKYQRKFYRNPVRLFLLKCIITLHWINPSLVSKTGKYLKELWKI